MHDRKISEILKYRFFRTFITIISSLTASGCIMIFPIPGNDYSGIENDYFGSLIIQSSNKSKSRNGFEALDANILEKIMQQSFLNMQIRNLFIIFKKYNGHCTESPKSAGSFLSKEVLCEVSKYWSINNVGYPSFGLLKDNRYSKQRTPGVSINFKFIISSDDEVTAAEIKISDATIHHPVY